MITHSRWAEVDESSDSFLVHVRSEERGVRIGIGIGVGIGLLAHLGVGLCCGRRQDSLEGKFP